jgi:hypothetical protein
VAPGPSRQTFQEYTMIDLLRIRRSIRLYQAKRIEREKESLERGKIRVNGWE